MSSARALVSVVMAAALASVVVPSDARATACTPGARRGVPVRVTRGPADLGMLPEGCGATELVLSVRGTLALALDDFYGSIDGAFGVRGRVALRRRLWLSFSLPALEARFAANATVEAASFDLGAGSVGAHLGIDFGERLRIAPYFRLLVPTETAYQTGTRLGYELGAVAVVRAARRLEVVAGALAASSFVVLDDRQESVVSLGLVGDVVWHPLRWLSLAAGGAVRTVPADDDALDAIEARAEARLRLGRWSVALGGEIPLAGRDRTNARVAISVGREL